ncbi:uncharacterized protein cubi_01848 [Cryptosporidium ubiquitum]|uniref:CW-type domain-containing protein n=1 Tax=Cryptosporidium ubiquitum TaxID=857276 RepID=A0A1J4MMQ6_9CRYT|nr:uncharacterized protein cubi_01848 [Cryptosporidium ubiquitum]OII75327.1 hypothetical protein cubi_01848 [Cryptosporidium ubiquitum]
MEVSSDLVDWAQCELCKKWRKLPLGMNPNTLPEEWVCTMNTWDKIYNSCDVAEEVVGIPPENLNLSVPDQSISYSDFQSRSLKGRKKNFSNCSISNSLTQAINSKQINNQGLNLTEDITRNFRGSAISDSLLSKSLIDSLSDWCEELKNDQTCLLPSHHLKKNFPSCWPLEYQNLDDVSLFRNQFFESFEKSRSKNFSNSYEVLSNLKGSQSFPICILKNNIFNSKNHPLQGRSIITGTEVPIVFKMVGESVNGIFPVISNNQSLKYSNNQTNNPISLSNTQKSQGIISSIHGNSLELIPATRSDWESPFIDLSNSLFISNSVDFKLSKYNESWSTCNFSYSKLFPERDNLLLIPNYLSETNFDLKTINSKIITDEFSEQINVDILDLFPVFSWLENPNNFNHPMYRKISQSNLLIQTNKISKKCNINKNNTRNRNRQLDPDQLESNHRLRRSSRNTSKAQNSEIVNSESSLFSNKDDCSISIEPRNNGFQLKDEYKNKELDLLSTSGKMTEKLNENVDKVDSVDCILIDCSNEGNNFNDFSKDFNSDNLGVKENSEVNQFESKDFSEIGEKGSNQVADSKELDTLNEFDVLNETNLDNESRDLSGDGGLLFINSEINSEKLVEDDEYILPALGSHKRKSKLLLDSNEHFDSIKTEEIKHEIYEERNRNNKKRLRKRSLISSETSEKYKNNTNEIFDSELKPTTNEEVPVTYPEIDKEKVDGNINSETLNEKNPFHIIPRKKSLETVNSTSLSPKSDPWVPKSDSSASKRDNQLDGISQLNTHKIRHYNWQVDQKRQRTSDQRRPAQNSSCHRNYYYQNKHRILTSYESHNKHYSRHRNNHPNSDFVNHNPNNFFSDSHYYSQNSLPGNQLMPPTPANESSYNYSSFKGYINSKYSSSSSSNSVNSMTRHYRGR